VRLPVLAALAALAAGAARGADPAPADVLGPMSVRSGFSSKPRCPHGSHPVAPSGKSLQSYRCAPGDAPGSAAPDSAAPGIAERFSVPHELSFEKPASFRVDDAWSEDVPTLYLRLDGDRPGKPVTITITRLDARQSTYEPLKKAVARDVQWQGARDEGTVTLAGAKARATSVPSDTRSVYLPLGKDSYYSFVYTAPADAYERNLPAFMRLLKSLKVEPRAR
jgi:hypothetical protein